MDPNHNPGAVSEIDHWNEIAERVQRGERLFWKQHPRIEKLYTDKALIDGDPWPAWIPKALGRPAALALDLACGSGQILPKLFRYGTVRELVAADLDNTRFAVTQRALGDLSHRVRFVTMDVNQIRLEPDTYDLIYAIQSFHHFENLEHIYAEIHQALRPGGFCVLDEFVGPKRFQWTGAQLALTSQLLGIMPRHLRIYQNGVEKLEEGRSSVEDVIRVCPSEAIRSDEIVPLFYETFDVVHHKKLGGTIQHLLYSGIVHNFPDDDFATDHLINCIDGLERVFIDYGVIPSDFVLLIGRKKA